MENSQTTKITRYRDEIHGDIILDPVAVALLNTATLQRLGRVYQLGYTHLVYRGATHTRLSHVIGAYHMAGRFVDNLRDNYRLMSTLPCGAADPEQFLPAGHGATTPSLEERWLALRYFVQWAALLHDVGHIPLGHTLEDEFEGIFLSHDDFRSPRLPAIWWKCGGEPSELRKAFLDAAVRGAMPPELKMLGVDTETAYAVVMSICLYKEKRQVGPDRDDYQSFEAILERALTITGPKALDSEQREFVSLVRNQLNKIRSLFAPFMVDIVANTICADYMDYVRRDTANAGLDRQTDDRVLSQFLVGEYRAGESESQKRMALVLTDSRGKARLDACTGVVDLVRKRFRLAEIIYYHKTKVSASAMLAKALSLVGTPPEVPDKLLTPISLTAAPKYSRELADGKISVATLRRELSPTALLSPEIGDESLLLWLQYRAWEKLEDRVSAREDGGREAQRTNGESAGSERTDEYASILRGIGLLQLLGRRKLYKVFAQINEQSVIAVNGISGMEGVANREQVKHKLQDVLRLRAGGNGQADERANIEQKMASEAGWPRDSVLIYVPPIKSQAKGIETRALSNNGVVTLGHHHAVQDEVNALGKQYQRLWRTILLVHPDFQDDDLGLSAALDVFLDGVWNVDATKTSEAIAPVARFNYIPVAQRDGARLYRQLCSSLDLEWSSYLAAIRTVRPQSTLSSREQAYRGYLLSLNRRSPTFAKTLEAGFPKSSGVEDIVAQQLGPGPNVDAIRSLLTAWVVQPTTSPHESSAPLSQSEKTPSPPASKKEISESAFESQCRAVFRYYIPAEEHGRLRPHHRDFISRNKARTGSVRFALVEKLRNYDISQIPGIVTQFNREYGDRTAEKLRQIEESIGPSATE